MNTIRNCISRRRIYFVALILILVVSSSSALFAQTAPMAQRLSPDTVFCIQWHGKQSLGDGGNKNHVLQLMEDPAFAPAWLSLASRLHQERYKPGVKDSGVTLPDVISFLDNPTAFGVAAIPNESQASTQDGTLAHFGVFVVYDATGKRDLIQKWKDLGRAASKVPVEITKYDFGGTTVEVQAAGKNVSYSAQADNYFLGSDQKQVIEDLVRRFRGANAPATSLAQVLEYQEIRKFVGTDPAVEWFGRIPNLDELSPRGPNGKTMSKLTKNIQLEKIHVAGGGLSFAGEATRMRGAVLGDTSPGGLFDLEGASTDAFQTQAVVNGSSNFSISRFNLLAMYQLFRGAAMGMLPPQQSGNILILEGAAQKFLGMSIADALALIRDEVASASSYSADGSIEQLYAVTIQNSDAVLRVLRAVIGSMVVAEDSSGSATYLDVAYPYTDPQTGMHRKKFYYLAVTPQMVLIAPRKAMLRETVQRLGSQLAVAPAGGVFANPEYSQLRSLLPGKLSAESATDLTEIPLDKLLAKLEMPSAESAKEKNGPPPDLSWLKPEVVSRHLHMVLSGLWKDSGGVYFDSYIQ